MEAAIYQGDPAVVIKSWVETFSDKMYLWSLYKTNSKEIAEDLVQETFMAAFQSIGKFRGKCEPKTWLFSILNNKIADHFRKGYRIPGKPANREKQSSEEFFFDSFFDGEGNWLEKQKPCNWPLEEVNPLDDELFIKMLKSCMGKLPRNWFVAVQLKYIGEQKSELICQQLQITTSNFWQILHRAKLQLRKCLEIHWFKK